MNVLILYGSMRANGNTTILADEFARGAEDAGHKIIKIKLRKKNINDCLGCGVCQGNNGKCI